MDVTPIVSAEPAWFDGARSGRRGRWLRACDMPDAIVAAANPLIYFASELMLEAPIHAV
jgi:hypothetical protein